MNTEIKKLISGEVLEDGESLKKYSKDASIFEITPRLVIFPKNTKDLCALVKYAASKKGEVSITARSAGTDMTGAAVGEGLILDMTKHFNKIIKIDRGLATTQPGVYYRDFEAETLKHSLFLPCYPASKEICTVGGMAANNSAGEKTLAYGQTKDFIQKLKVVLADGNEYTFEPLSKKQLDNKLKQKDFEGGIYQKMYELVNNNLDLVQKAKPQVSKNSTGYLLWEILKDGMFDLSKIFVGSQGTLGIITEIGFKLAKVKPHSSMVVIFLYNLDHLGEVINTVLKHQPESFESYDDQTLRFAVKFLPEVIKSLKTSNLLKSAWEFLPEIWMGLRHGYPKLVLLAEFTGDDEKTLYTKCRQVENGLSGYHLKTHITKGDESRKYWVIRRESFNLFRKHAGNKHTAPFIDDFVVRPELLPEFLPKLNKILLPYRKKFVYTIAGHVGNGNFHIIPLVNLADAETRQLIPKIMSQVYSLVFEYKGSMSGEHNDGLIRGPYLRQMYGDKVYDLFKQVKNIFDPDHIFNPHKKVDATHDYALLHMSQTN